MKKIFYIIGLCFLTFQSCKKDEVEGTATQKLAGEWYVTADALKADGSLFEKDVYGLGHFMLATYNTESNDLSKIWIEDRGNFWDFKGIINGDVNTLTFSGEDVQNVSYDSKFTVTNGKILKAAATTPSGMKADSVVFEIKFDDDDPVGNGFDRYRITGYRYTGLANDD
ncbi:MULTISPECIES: lipid-binding protein [unclassified Sphingobacterium]|uniref:lipid-binding protein n=1 Tax=unclassified Sphingobacterium TaxID=2609468 RepID=UPI0025E334A7|nr:MULTISPECIES: lipid-binding protein [unclassified Sphingobacterium]